MCSKNRLAMSRIQLDNFFPAVLSCLGFAEFLKASRIVLAIASADLLVVFKIKSAWAY